jgi:predicted Zn-dependent peptidase
MYAGPVLLVEPLPGAATAAVGAWIRRGSAHEDDAVAGITHLLEHLLLRRCGARTPEAIAELIDSLGGAVDAFTTREACAVTAHVPAERLDEALGLILDAVFAPRFAPEDVELERKVVAAEFDLVQDSPAETAAENALRACWGEHPLARPVLGRREVVQNLQVADLARHHGRHFTTDNLLMVVAGPVQEERIATRLSTLPGGGAPPRALAPLAWQPGVVVEERDGLEQIYANLVFPGLGATHPDILVLGVLHQLLGGGASSRLFRELRERLGLVYEIATSIYAATGGGVLDLTFSAPVRNVEACWDGIFTVLGEVGAGGVSEGEVELARRALIAGVTLGSEGTDALMEANAGEFMARGRRFDPRRVRRELEAVTREQVRALAARVVRLDLVAGAVCGPRAGVRLPATLAQRVA